jgi:hypothetical protein
MRRGAETGEEVVLIEHEWHEQGGRRGKGPHAGITFCIWKHEQSCVASSAAVRSTGTRAPLLGSPRALGEARGWEGQLHIRIPPKWVRSTGTPPRRKEPRALGWEWWGQRADSSVHQHGAYRHGQHDYRSCDSAYTRQQSQRANHGNKSKWKHPSEIVPAPVDAKDLEGKATSRTQRILNE